MILAALVGQAIVGHRVYNEDELAHHGQTISMGRYLVSSAFGQTVMENWQSEHLQFTLYVLLTVWFVQRGSARARPRVRRAPVTTRHRRRGSTRTRW